MPKRALEVTLDGRTVHKILDKSHFEEIQQISDMAHIQDYVEYAKYLKWQGFWDVDMDGLTYNVFFKNNS